MYRDVPTGTSSLMSKHFVERAPLGMVEAPVECKTFEQSYKVRHDTNTQVKENATIFGLLPGAPTQGQLNY